MCGICCIIFIIAFIIRCFTINSKSKKKVQNNSNIKLKPILHRIMKTIKDTFILDHLFGFSLLCSIVLTSYVSNVYNESKIIYLFLIGGILGILMLSIISRMIFNQKRILSISSMGLFVFFSCSEILKLFNTNHGIHTVILIMHIIVGCLFFNVITLSFSYLSRILNISTIEISNVLYTLLLSLFVFLFNLIINHLLNNHLNTFYLVCQIIFKIFTCLIGFLLICLPQESKDDKYTEILMQSQIIDVSAGIPLDDNVSV